MTPPATAPPVISGGPETVLDGAAAPSMARIDAVVHLGFAVLMVASAVRYVMRHRPAENLWVLALAAAACLIYGFIAVLKRRRRLRPGWIFVLVAPWCALVLVAPSFAWGSFALFFLCRTALAGAVAHLATGTLAVATALGLFRLSGGSDIAMLLGPLATGAMLALILDRMEHDVRVQRRLHAEVSAAQGQLAVSERRAGTIAERERVAREIHDTVTQGLASGVLLLEAASRSWPGPRARDDVIKAGALLRQNLADTRSLVHDLATPGLDGVPLPKALWQAAALHLPQVRVQETGQERPLPADVRHAVLRVVQSACANIKRHAGPAQATITLGYLPGAVTLDVYDDGVGFDLARIDPPSESGGYGIRAMRARVEQLGGAFSVESTPGEGTIVAVQLPTDGTLA
ncbi:sensor histidine kinase [Specibacter sp. NPDC057265]|uniref:sensor histidine kinase n=1 Tax=Specibacter sp. NPDC057265 TaxID=3346075 RepID=UPI003632414A